MQEVQDEKDAPDSIEEFLSFLNTLTSDIEVSLIQLCMHCVKKVLYLNLRLMVSKLR